MIPPKTDPRWKNLIEGNIQHTFKLVSAGMCLARNQRHVHLNPNPETLQAAIDEVHAFFTKYENLLAEDLPVIFK